MENKALSSEDAEARPHIPSETALSASGEMLIAPLLGATAHLSSGEEETAEADDYIDRDSEDDLLSLCEDVRRSVPRGPPLIQAPSRLSNTSSTNMAGLRSGFNSRRGTDLGDRRVVTPPRSRRGPASLPQLSSHMGSQYFHGNGSARFSNDWEKEEETQSRRMLETILSTNASGAEHDVDTISGMRELNVKLGDLLANRARNRLDSITEVRRESEGESPSKGLSPPAGLSPENKSFIDLETLMGAKRGSDSFSPADFEALRANARSPALGSKTTEGSPAKAL